MHLKQKINFRKVSVNRRENTERAFFLMQNTHSVQKKDCIKIILTFWCNRNFE